MDNFLELVCRPWRKSKVLDDLRLISLEYGSIWKSDLWNYVLRVEIAAMGLESRQVGKGKRQIRESSLLSPTSRPCTSRTPGRRRLSSGPGTPRDRSSAIG